MYEIFEKELNYITNEELKEFIIECLEKAPEYFYHVPASSSGKYHPKMDLGEGGLIRHTKACVGVGIDLLRCEQFIENSKWNIDIVVSSLLLHDTIKNGFEDSGHTLSEHPLLACDFIENVFNKNNYNEKCITIQKELIKYCIKSHMGKWNMDKEEKEILPKPKAEIEKLVHLADYIASRKYINFGFEV